MEQAPASHLDRVASKIASSVLEFCRRNSTFTMSELEFFVSVSVDKTTPGSAGRILRYLKNDGKVKYKCVNRAKAKYQIEAMSAVPF